ncbi:MAG: 3-hydroxyacyl-CoA dehydrogenase NAD-binding domain-containing protein [Hyphomicrobiaceae bacterium]
MAIITIDNPPVNALSQGVRAGLLAAINTARADETAKAVLLVGHGRTFIAGADIREFGKPPQPPSLPDVIQEIENCPMPVIAVLHGAALGGGLEVALGCHYRIALEGTKLGLPEVTLGILPGAGGTQRMPRLVGVEAALDLITSGRHVGAAEALRLGFIDEVAESGDQLKIGLAYAARAIDENLPPRRTRDLGERISASDEVTAVLAAARERVAKKMRGQVAPAKCIDAVQASLELPFEEGIKRERELFLELMASPQRQGLIHAFFAERTVAKVPEIKAAEPREVNSLAVIGGGTMGAGIAVAFIVSGFPVVMVERDAENLERGKANVLAILDGGVKRGKMSAGERDTLMVSRFTGTTDLAAIAGVDLVIEAVFEDMGVKRSVFAELDAACKPGSILATNTSYLDINEIARATSRPGDVIGLHFFSPAHLMRLLEVVVADETAPDVIATAFALAKRLKKVAVRAGVCDGFIGNRILTNYRKSIDYMVADGASPYAIDRAVVNFGFPMGPFAVGDMSGLDISWANRKRKAASRDPRERYIEFADRICERGWYGRKTGRGFYLYGDGVPAGRANPDVEEIITQERRENGITGREFTEDEIMRRYMAALINEAAKVLEEGIALQPVDVDVTMLFGYGFPRWRGGPMNYVDMTGLDRVLSDVQAFAQEDAFFWKPAELLIDLVAGGKNFESLNDVKLR